MDILGTSYPFIFTLTNEQAGLFFKAICAYSVGVDARGDIEDKTVRTCIGIVKPIIDRDREIKEKRRECGRKGGAPRGNNNASKSSKNQAKNNQKQAKQANGCLVDIDFRKALGKESKLIASQVFAELGKENNQKQANGCFENKDKEEGSPLNDIYSNPLFEEEKEISPVINTPKKSTPHKRPMPNYDYSIVDRPEFLDIFKDWLEYKHERNEDYKPRGFKACYSKLVNDSNGDPDVARKIVMRAMGNNSMGFFPMQDWKFSKPQDNGKVDTLNVNDRYDISKYDI